MRTTKEIEAKLKELRAEKQYNDIFSKSRIETTIVTLNWVLGE